jgi:hypothetical protein
MSDMFDPDQFMSSESEGEMSTEFTPVPEGEYNAVITSVEPRQFTSAKGTFTVLDITWAIDDATVSEVTGMESPKVRQTAFLDLTASGGLDMGKGKNITLGRVREAIGQNNPGPWSPTQLEGNVAIVKVEHRMYEGKTFADVKNVAKVA